MAHESLPDYSFSESEREFLRSLDEEMRPMESIEAHDYECRTVNRELYDFIQYTSAALGGEDPVLKAFYAREFTILAYAVQRVQQQDTMDPAWADSPPILPI